MALETKLFQRLDQRLVMTPQLRQAIKILQVSRAELETLIDEELSQNPVLEEGLEQVEPDEAPRTDESPTETPQNSDEFYEAREDRETTNEIEPNAERMGEIDWKEYLENYSNDWHGAADAPADSDDDDRRPTYENFVVKSQSLTDHVVWQLRLLGLDAQEEALAAVLVGNMDDDGYLQIEIDEIAFQLGVDFDLVESVLRRIQGLEPAGVGARDLRECLLLQLRAEGLADSLAARIVAQYLDQLEGRRYDKMARDLGVTTEEIVRASQQIATLEPKPGRNYGGGDVRYIIPDVFVQVIDSELQVWVNDDGMPRLRVSKFYRQMLGGDEDGEAKRYIQDKMRSATWLIKSIHQRQRTLLLVAQSIVRFQREFFEFGVSHLKPLVLKDVANDIGMHESTVSRATANKYMHCPQGTFELKYFFTSSLQGADGDEVSAESVKERIRAIIQGEDPKRPLSDQHIAKMLGKEQVEIARRTVAKYRELMGILPSSKRRQAV